MSGNNKQNTNRTVNEIKSDTSSGISSNLSVKKTTELDDNNLEQINGGNLSDCLNPHTLFKDNFDFKCRRCNNTTYKYEGEFPSNFFSDLTVSIYRCNNCSTRHEYYGGTLIGSMI